RSGAHDPVPPVAARPLRDPGAPRLRRHGRGLPRRDTRLGRDVAIKVLPERYAQDPQAVARFHRELRATAALSHPTVVTVHAVGEDHGVAYAVMELLEGQTLAARLRQGVIGWRQAVEIAAAV